MMLKVDVEGGVPDELGLIAGGTYVFGIGSNGPVIAPLLVVTASTEDIAPE